MSEPENFLTRWSRRKLAEGEPPAPERENLAAQDKDKEGKTPSPARPLAAATDIEEPPFDPASLPPIDTIDANTDVTAFLRPGVPTELSRAALRRAWSTDPAIRDFVGLVENGWDFNDPNAMPGFGPIEPAEVARLAEQLLGALPEAKPEKAVETAESAAMQDGGAPAAPVGEPSASNEAIPGVETANTEAADVQHKARDVATQKDFEA